MRKYYNWESNIDTKHTFVLNWFVVEKEKDYENTRRLPPNIDSYLNAFKSNSL